MSVVAGMALGVSAANAVRLERVLAVVRACLATSALGAIYLDPTEPARLAAVAYGVLGAYVVFALAVWAWARRAPRLESLHVGWLHGIDILFAAALTFVSEGPVSPFFLFFLFVVLAAAYRWGFAGTLATSGVTVTVFLAQTTIAAAGPWNQTWFASMDFEVNQTILRVTYLLITGVLLGILAEQEKTSRAELAAIADTMRQPRIDLGVGGSVNAVARSLLATFDAAAVDIVLDDFEGRRTVLWHAAGSAAPARRTPLDAATRALWLFPDPGRTWLGERRPGDEAVDARIVDADVWPLSRGRVEIPAGLERARACRRLAVGQLGLQGEWAGRIYLYEPTRPRSVETLAHFLDNLVDHITPALTNVMLQRRLRARVTAAERARVARELHDGAIQSLFGVEMKIEALRRRASPLPPEADRELDEVQTLLRREVLALRELMQALRPIELDTSEQLPDVIAGVVERFRRDTGVSARFVHTGSTVSLPPPAALEVVRVVQEALVNVRKHSRARNVLVRLSGGDLVSLIVEDDGVGFDFEGYYTADELDQRRIGPAIIKERARMAGAQLAIESTRGVGARLELTLGGPHG